MDLLDRIMDYLEGDIANLGLYTKFKIDILDSGANALTIRYAPSSPTEEYYDRGSENVIAFQVLTKHTTQRKAVQTLYDISKALKDLVDIQSSDDSYIFSKITVNTNPTFVDVTSQNSYIYTALFNAHIFVY